MVKCLALMKASNWVYYGKLLGTILGNADGITLGIDVGIDMGSLDGTLDRSNYGKLRVLLI